MSPLGGLSNGPMTGTGGLEVEAGIVGAGIDHHRVAIRLQPAPVDIFVHGLEGVDQRVIGRVPGARSGQVNHGLFRQRDLNAEFAFGLRGLCGRFARSRMPPAERDRERQKNGGHRSGRQHVVTP